MFIYPICLGKILIYISYVTQTVHKQKYVYIRLINKKQNCNLIPVKVHPRV